MPFSLQAENLAFDFAGEHLFANVNFTLGAGSMLIITGRSGSGKSTMLEICAGLRKPSSGRVHWNNRPVSSLSQRETSIMRRTMGYVFQPHALISNLTVFDNIALPLRYHLRLPDDKIRTRVAGHMELFGISSLSTKRPEELSVGQSRLSSIARAFAMNPEVVFLDEPLSGLDPQTGRVITDILRRMAVYNDVTMIIVSHEADFIRSMDCTVAFLEKGSVTMHSSTELDGALHRTSTLAAYFNAKIA